ncbi:aspartyl protease family protein At5g10770-like [Prosopis cineraria]|uniref:aspartyl protease family protein At5g10770-like n=1 Tax=Prosopis cineraria TaxID=364024 RepID=UPI0024107549|nr:aspartyl protease family protein At5g10770-like [Prosopis cineraria]
MASSSPSNPFLVAASFSLACFFYFLFISENKSFVNAIRSEEAFEFQHTHHRVTLDSLSPSSSCSSHQGGSRNGSMEMVHKHGPCSKLKQRSSSSSLTSSSFIIPHSEILKQDEARVRAINSMLSRTLNLQEANTSKIQVPARSAISLGRGNYYVTVGLGTPKTDLSLEFDTGSDLTWTQCKPCTGSCYKQKDSIFDPSQSSSYSNIPCTSSLCSRLSSACYAPTKACLYRIKYGDGSSAIGSYAKETLTIPPNDVFQNFLFGCGQDNRGIFRGTAGLIGLSRSAVSIVQQTAQNYGKIFSYCIPSTPSTVGYLSFGGASSKSNIKYISYHSISEAPSLYGVNLIGINLGGVNLPISASTFSSGTIIDSGTVITRLPRAAYGPLREAFGRFMSARYPKGDPDDLLDTCYDMSGFNTVSIPKVSLTFEGGVKVELDVIGTVYILSTRQVCLGFAANQNDDDVAIIGNNQQKTLEVVYDVDGPRIGFRAGGCK